MTFQVGINIETSPTYGLATVQDLLLDLFGTPPPDNAPRRGYVRLTLPEQRPHVDLALIQWLANVLRVTPILTTKQTPKDSFTHTLANLRLMRDGDTADVDMDYREGILPYGCIIECPNEWDSSATAGFSYTALLTQCAIIRDFCLEEASLKKGLRFLGPSLVKHEDGSPYAQFVTALGSNTGNLHTYNVPSDAGNWVYDLAQKTYFEAVYSKRYSLVTEVGVDSDDYNQGTIIPEQLEALKTAGYGGAVIFNLSTATRDHGLVNHTTGVAKSATNWALVKSAVQGYNL